MNGRRPGQHQHRRSRPGREREKAPFFLHDVRSYVPCAFWNRLLLYDEHGQESGRHRTGAGIIRGVVQRCSYDGILFCRDKDRQQDGRSIRAPARLPAVRNVLCWNRLFPLGTPFLSLSTSLPDSPAACSSRRSWHMQSDTSMRTGNQLRWASISRSIASASRWVPFSWVFWSTMPRPGLHSL